MGEMNQSTIRCVIGDPDRPHTATPGLHVCNGHRAALYEQLRGIVDTVARIYIRPAATAPLGSGRPGTLASQRSLLDLESLALAGPIAPGQINDADGWDDHHPVAVVGSWARLVREERQITPPDGPTVLTADVDLLIRHLDWCCAQPWIDDMATELGDSFARVHRADPDRHRPGDEGRCPIVGDGPHGTCGGRLQRDRGTVPWIVRPDRCERIAVDVPAGVIRCQRCAASWGTVEEEARLRVMRADAARDAVRPRNQLGRPMYTAAELVSRGHVSSVSNVRVIAHRRKIVSVDGYYDPDDFRKEVALRNGA